ncbi:MAG: histidine kinase dimerization/phosphoacceptor domain -containing protein [Candidatus Tenebribacter burtonii]|nr:histidine kinase dimerization/phosphoacceptor domain -containing protein [Candidatus Tenebribacter burtonii]
MKIRTKLGIIPITIAVTMLITALVTILMITQDIIYKQTENQLLTASQYSANNIKMLLNDYKKYAQQLTIESFFTNVLDLTIDQAERLTECNLKIKRTIDAENTVSRIRVLNIDGIVIASSHEDVGFDQSAKEIFLKGKKSVYIGDIHKSEYTGNLVFSISAPIFIEDIFSGVLIVNFDAQKHLFNIVTNKIGLGETGETYLVNKDNFLITPSRFVDDVIFKTKINAKQTTISFSEYSKNVLPENMKKKAIRYNNYRGEKVLGINYYISEMQWNLFTEIDVKEVNKPIFKMAGLLIIIFSFLLIAILISLIKLSRDITIPIMKLQKGILKIVNSNLEYKVDNKRSDEIGELSRSFDSMTEKLIKAQQELNDYTKNFKTMIEQRTAELKLKVTESVQQRQAIINIATDLDEINHELELEIIERKNAEQIQKLFYNISNAMNITDNIQHLFRKIKKYLSDVIDTTNFYIASYDEKTDTLSLPFNVDEKDNYETFPAGKTITKYLIDIGKPLLATKEVITELTKKNLIETIGATSEIWLGVPLRIENKVIGVLAVQSYDDPNLYTEDDVEILTFASKEIALAIKHKLAADQIKRNLEEKEILLRELYHRTKNNMQIIISMLRIQSASLENRTHTKSKDIDFMFDSLDKVINKIKSMSLVHQKLYQSQDLSHINLKEYINDLVRLLMVSYRVQLDTISLKLELNDLFVLIDLAIPLGLVLNELISNVFIHAFSYNGNDTICIQLYKDDDNTINILISDNGAGIPNEIDLENVNSMGLRTVFDLVNYQLKGEVTYKTENGLRWHIRLKDNIYSKRV